MTQAGALLHGQEASVRAKVQHPFYVIKKRFRHKKVCHKGLPHSTAQLFSPFGLANLVLANKDLISFIRASVRAMSLLPVAMWRSASTKCVRSMWMSDACFAG